MEIPVLIEPLPGKGFRAQGGAPLGLEAEGRTREEALRRLKELIASRIDGGAELVSVVVPGGEDPWVSSAGMFRDEPLFAEWQAAIVKRREEAE